MCIYCPGAPITCVHMGSVRRPSGPSEVIFSCRYPCIFLMELTKSLCCSRVITLFLLFSCVSLSTVSSDQCNAEWRDLSTFVKRGIGISTFLSIWCWTSGTVLVSFFTTRLITSSMVSSSVILTIWWWDISSSSSFWVDASRLILLQIWSAPHSSVWDDVIVQKLTLWFELVPY